MLSNSSFSRWWLTLTPLAIASTMGSIAFALGLCSLRSVRDHMDIDSVNALAVALNSFNGGLVIVSHDEYFVETVCSEIWQVGKKKCEKFNGNFTDYRKIVRKANSHKKNY